MIIRPFFSSSLRGQNPSSDVHRVSKVGSIIIVGSGLTHTRKWFNHSESSQKMNGQPRVCIIVYLVMFV